MEVIRETLWKRWFCTPIKPPAKNSNICLSETAYQHKGTRKKCKKTNQAAIIQWQRQCLMDKPHRKPWPKSKTSDISKQSPSPLHHTFLLGRARFTAQPLSALISALRLRACCRSVLDTTISNSLTDHMEQSSNSSELLATFSEYFVVTVMRHPSS